MFQMVSYVIWSFFSGGVLESGNIFFIIDTFVHVISFEVLKLSQIESAVFQFNIIPSSFTILIFQTNICRSINIKVYTKTNV